MLLYNVKLGGVFMNSFIGWVGGKKKKLSSLQTLISILLNYSHFYHATRWYHYKKEIIYKIILSSSFSKTHSLIISARYLFLSS